MYTGYLQVFTESTRRTQNPAASGTLWIRASGFAFSYAGQVASLLRRQTTPFGLRPANPASLSSSEFAQIVKYTYGREADQLQAKPGRQ
jgi:hypothetical protein